MGLLLLLTHSHHIFFLKLPCHFLFVPIRPQLVYFWHFFCHTEWVLGAPFVYGKKSSTPHVLTHRRILSVFHGKTDSVISHLISLFSLTTLLLLCTPSLPFHQDWLPGVSGVHLCFTAWLQGQKHPPYIQTITHLLGFNPSSTGPIGEQPFWNHVHLICR